MELLHVSSGNKMMRKANKKDLKKVSEVFRIESSKKPYYQEWNEKTAIGKIKKLFSEGEIYVIEVNNEIVGFLSISKDSKKIWINEFWIDSKHQRKGFGKKILLLVEDRYRKKGFTHIELMSHHQSGASKFYNKLGYKDKGKYIFMSKKIR